MTLTPVRSMMSQGLSKSTVSCSQTTPKGKIASPLRETGVKVIRHLGPKERTHARNNHLPLTGRPRAMSRNTKAKTKGREIRAIRKLRGYSKKA